MDCLWRLYIGDRQPLTQQYGDHGDGDGRVPALILAAGVVSGSMFWALIAASRLTALLENYAWTLTFVKVAGGL